MSMQVPAFLSQLNTGRKLAEEGQRGLGGGGVPTPSLSIRAQKFTAIDAVGDQRVVGKLDANGIYVDVIVVDLNPSVSKVYYADKFDPAATEFKAPTCWSDNGIGPSENAQSPQASTCASCPLNAWGSSVSANGKETKACNDAKKIGVMIDGDDKPMVFLLRIPPASLKNWKTVCQMVAAHGVDLNMVKMRIRFDEKVQGVLLFELVGWIDEDQVQTILALQDDKLAAIVGRNDKPKNVQLTGPSTTAAPQIAAPAPAPAFAPAPIAAPEEPKKTRTTKAKAEDIVPTFMAPSQPSDAAAMQMLNTAPPAQPTANVQFGVAQNPPVADASLDKAIADALNFSV